MATPIDKTKIIQDVWQNFYNTLNGNVSTVTASDGSQHSVQFYASAFPDRATNSKSSYPIVIVGSPNISWDDFTLTKKWANGTIVVDIFSTKAEVTDKMADDVINLIETNRDDYASVNLINVNLESTYKDEFFRGAIKVHMKSCTFGFRLAFAKTIT